MRGEKNKQVLGTRVLQAGSGQVGALERSVVLLQKEMTQLLYIPSVGQSVTVGVLQSVGALAYYLRDCVGPFPWR